MLEMLAARRISAAFATNGSGRVLCEGGAEEEDYLGILRAMSELENICDTDFCEYFGDITDIMIVTPYADERMIALAESERSKGRNVLFYCNGEVSSEFQLFRVGRIHKYLFLKD